MAFSAAGEGEIATPGVTPSVKAPGDVEVASATEGAGLRGAVRRMIAAGGKAPGG